MRKIVTFFSVAFIIYFVVFVAVEGFGQADSVRWTLNNTTTNTFVKGGPGSVNITAQNQTFSAGLGGTGIYDATNGATASGFNTSTCANLGSNSVGTGSEDSLTFTIAVNCGFSFTIDSIKFNYLSAPAVVGSDCLQLFSSINGAAKVAVGGQVTPIATSTAFRVTSAGAGFSIILNPGQKVDLFVIGKTNNNSANDKISIKNFVVFGTTTASVTTAGITEFDASGTTFNDGIICNGNSATLTGTGGGTYSWAPAASLSASTGTAVTASPTSNVTYTVTVTTNGCSATDTQIISVNTTTAGITETDVSGTTANDGIICNGSSATLTGTGGGTFAWAPSTGLSATTGSPVTASPNSNTTYTVTVTANGCIGTATRLITVNVIPVAGITETDASGTTNNDGIICNGSSATLTGTGGGTYTWAPSTGLSATTGSPVIASPISNTTYTVTVTTNGCSATDTQSITVNALPTAGITETDASGSTANDGIICNGGSATLTATGGSLFTWAPSTGLSATTGSPVTATPGLSTTYNVTVTNANGCIATSSETITVNALPTAGITETDVSGTSNNDGIICNGGSATLTGTGGSIFTWAPSTGLSATTGSPVTATPGVNTTYTVTVTNANNCSSTKSITINVNGLPTAGITEADNSGTSPNDGIICNGSSATLTGTGGGSYAWAPATGLSATTGTVVTASPTTNTTYTVTVTNGNNCSSTQSVTITVNGLASAGITETDNSGTTADDGIICNGGSATLTGSGGGTYSWSPSTGLSATVGSPVTASPTFTTSYTVTVTNGNNCSSTKSVTIIVKPLPQGSLSSNSPICNGEQATFTWNSTSGTGPFTIVINGATYSNISSGSSFNVIPNPTSPTIYAVTSVTDSNGCPTLGGFTDPNETITVNPLPQGSLTSNSPICEGDQATFTWNSLSGTGPFSIIINGQTYTVNSGSPFNVTPSPSVTTNYQVDSITDNSSTQCLRVNGFFDGTETISVNPLPQGSLTSNSPICNGDQATFTWTSTSGTGPFDIVINAQNYNVSSGTPFNVTPNPTSTNTYVVSSVKDATSTHCERTNGFTVGVDTISIFEKTVLPNSIIGDTSLCNGESTILTLSGGSLGTDPSTPPVWKWYSGTGSCTGTLLGTGPTLTWDTVATTSPVTTTIFVKAEGGGSPCADPAGCVQVDVTVNPVPVLSNQTIFRCSDDTLNFTINPNFTTDVVYEWTSSADPQISNNTNQAPGTNGIIKDILHNAEINADHNVVYTITAIYVNPVTLDTCRSVAKTLTVIVNPSPTVPVISSLPTVYPGGTHDSLCGGSTNIGFQIKNFQQGINYIWSVDQPSATIINSADSVSGHAVITFVKNNGSSYTAQISAIADITNSGTGHCSSKNTTLNITILPGDPIGEAKISRRKGTPDMLIYEDNTVDGYKWGVDSAGTANGGKNILKQKFLLGEFFQVYVPDSNQVISTSKNNLDTINYNFWVMVYKIDKHGLVDPTKFDTCYSRVYYNGPYKKGVITIPVVPEDITISAFPNPNNGQFDLLVSGNIYGNIKIKFVNTLGQEILEKQVEKKEGSQKFSLDALNIPAGLYMVRIEGQNQDFVVTKVLIY